MSCAAKKSTRDDAPISTVKRECADGESFNDLVQSLTSDIASAKSDAMSRIDKELHWFLKLPGPLLSFAIATLQWLDRRGIAPKSITAPDPMYCSVFLANLGSLGIDAAYHHLYEYGNCPLFVTIGRVTNVVGQVATVQLRFTYDERIEDGFYCARALERLKHLIEQPETWVV
jgi:hypothetical protein